MVRRRLAPVGPICGDRPLTYCHACDRRIMMHVTLRMLRFPSCFPLSRSPIVTMARTNANIFGWLFHVRSRRNAVHDFTTVSRFCFTPELGRWSTGQAFRWKDSERSCVVLNRVIARSLYLIQHLTYTQIELCAQCLSLKLDLSAPVRQCPDNRILPSSGNH